MKFMQTRDKRLLDLEQRHAIQTRILDGCLSRGLTGPASRSLARKQQLERQSMTIIQEAL